MDALYGCYGIRPNWPLPSRSEPYGWGQLAVVLRWCTLIEHLAKGEAVICRHQFEPKQESLFSPFLTWFHLVSPLLHKRWHTQIETSVLSLPNRTQTCHFSPPAALAAFPSAGSNASSNGYLWGASQLVWVNVINQVQKAAWGAMLHILYTWSLQMEG